MIAWSKAVVAYWIIFIQYKHRFCGSRMRVRGLIKVRFWVGTRGQGLGLLLGLGLVGFKVRGCGC